MARSSFISAGENRGIASSAQRSSLSKSDHESLWEAFGEARRAVTALTPAQAAMERNHGVRFFTANPGQRLTARFRNGEARLESGCTGAGSEWSATLRLVRVNGKAFAKAPRPVARGTEVVYRHDSAVAEWYRNRPEGIEHGFTLAKCPTAEGNFSELRLELDLQGLQAEEATGGNGQALKFVEPGAGRSILGYGKLQVSDSRGVSLPARMEVAANRIAIRVADAGAVYPVTIDPLITSQEASLGPEVVGDGAQNDRFGDSVALSGDTALIGADRDDTAAGIDAGSAYVFTFNGTAWSLQAKLMADDAAASDCFGSAVALSEDTALVGARYDDTGDSGEAGSAYVFARTGSTWGQQAKLLASDGASSDQFGSCVAIDGNTALVGAPFDDTTVTTLGFDAGSVYVFTRSGATWSEQAKLTADDGAQSDHFGVSVALSGDTVLVGASLDDVNYLTDTGSAYVFTRSIAAWSQQAKLTAETGAKYDYLGSAVALSGDTALVGVSGDDGSSGSACVFTRSGTTWSQQAKLVHGGSVALSGDTALIGYYKADTGAGIDAGCVYVYTRSETTWSRQATLTASDGAASDYFGCSVALSGDRVLVGAYGDTTTGVEKAGSAYLFTRAGSSWSEEAKLTAGDGASFDSFGGAVALSGNTALIGAPYDDLPTGIDAGSAYILTRSGSSWSQQAKLAAADGASKDHFGASVAISGDTALVGAAWHDAPAGSDAGTAYVYARSGTTWSQQAELMASDAATGDNFGRAVALDEDTALIGASFASTAGGVYAGCAYVFSRSGTIWSQVAKFTASDGADRDYFGSAVAVSGDTALVGAYGDDTAPGTSAGSAYVFTRSGTVWSQQAKLTADDGAENDFFGASLALSGDTALIGAHGDDLAAETNAGSAYVFARTGGSWALQAKLTSSDAQANDSLGCCVGLSGNTALVGACGDNDRTGSAYVFIRLGSTWGQKKKLVVAGSAIMDQFGASVALSGDTALVGAPLHDRPHPVTGELAMDGGSVAVFRLRFVPTLSEWAIDCELDPADQSASATPFQDGVPNLLKYAFNLNGGGPDSHMMTPATGQSGLPSIVLEGQGTNRTFRFEFVRRIDSELSYLPQVNSTLEASSWTFTTDEPDVRPINPEWERVVVEEPVCGSARMMFGRVLVRP